MLQASMTVHNSSRLANSLRICAKWGLDVQSAANATVCREVTIIGVSGRRTDRWEYLLIRYDSKTMS